MTHYAITQVHFQNQRVASVLLHVVQNAGPGAFALAKGLDTDFSQVAALLARGDRVHIAKTVGLGVYANADEVQLKQGNGDLISVWIANRPARFALKDLPRY